MIRATAGTWLNYATTLLFQVALASTFGVSQETAVFQFSYALWVACSGAFVSCFQMVLTPRLGGKTGLTDRHVWRTSVATLAVAMIVFISLAIGGWFTGPLAARTFRVDEATAQALLTLAAVVGLLQVVAGFVAAMAIARGHRFRPAVAPAGTSTAAVVGMLLMPESSTVDVAWFLVGGSGVQVALLLTTFSVPRRDRGVAKDERLARTALLSFAAFALLSSIAPLELLAASLRSPEGASAYAYASRSLAVASQLLIGGALMAALGDWSRLRREGQGPELTREVRRALVMVLGLVAAACVVAATLGEQLVGAVYERGSFDAHDTADTYGLLLLCLGGFAFDGISLVASQALLALHKTDLTIITGVVRFALRVPAMFIMGVALGASGVALAWTLSSLLCLALNLWWLRGSAILPQRASLRPAGQG